MLNPFQKDLSRPINADDYKIGNPSAKVRIVVYADFANPELIPIHGTIKEILANQGEDVVVAYRHFPETTRFPHAYATAQALEASVKQDKLEEMIEQVLANQDKLSDGFLRQYARAIDLDKAQFEDDFSSTDTIKRIKDNIESGKESQVEVTPVIFVNSVRQSTLSARFIHDMIAGDGEVSG